MKGKKRAFAIVMCLVLVIAGVLFTKMGKSNVMASTLAEDGSSIAIPYSEVNATAEIPVPTDDTYADWLFAGWFSDAECTSATSKGSSSYAKFVPSTVLATKAQIATVKDGDSYIIRFISTVESLNYAQVGFEVTYEGAEKPMYGYIDTVYERIDSIEDSVKYEFNPKAVNTKSEYFVTAKLRVTDESKDYTVRAFWDTLSGQRVYGAERCVSVNDGKLDTPVNVSFAVAEDATIAKGDTLAVTYGDKSGSATVLCVGGGEATVRLTLASGDTKTSLPSASKFVFKDGSVEAGSAIYRNLYTKYTGGTTYDKTWYTVDPTADEFVVVTSADFYGMAEIFNTDKLRDKFLTKTVMLGASININEGEATETGWVPKNGAPVYKWTAIGRDTDYTRFAGVFDGQGETISGIVLVDDAGTNAQYQGLFGITHGSAVLKNFRLENSYFESTSAGGWLTGGVKYAMLGSVAGQTMGTLEGIYSNAIVVSENIHVGGIVARANCSDTKSVISNCWFDGSVICKTDKAQDFRAGGILGQRVSNSLRIENCLNTGKIQYTFATDADVAVYVGGIYGGANTTINLYNCLNAGDVIVQTTAGVAHTKGVDAVTPVPESVKTANYAITESNASVSANAVSVAEENAIGFISYNFMKDLGFYTSNNPEGAWAVRANGVPAPKCLVDEVIDVAWYYEAEGDFVIKTAEELYGFSAVAKKNAFSGKTIKLAANIKLNSGNAEEWGKKAPARAWDTVGIDSCNFAGTFDGQGHTISGAYTKASANYVGFFGLATEKSTIKNLKLVNSYFEVDGSGYYGLGSMTGNTYGVIDTVYTDAILVSNGLQVGGITGRMNATNDAGATINNCWYAGTIYMNGNAYQGGGIVGNMVQKHATITNCLFDGTIKSERTAADASIGGIAGIQANAGTYTITGCLSAGTIESKGATGIGSIIGIVKNNEAIYDLAGVYATTECYEDTHLLGGSTVKVNGAMEAITKANMSGDKAFTLYGLDYTNYWVAKKDSTPELKSFSKADFTPSATQPHTGWYNPGKTEMVLYTVADMYGFSSISAKDNFSGKTVKLGADIVLNEGDAKDWASKAPANTWTPIGRSKTFAGTFDGQGHTISGMYVSETQSGAGLFRDASLASAFKNFCLVNSYVTSTKSIVGAVAGWGYGAMDSVYSDAIISVGDSANTVGGLIGAKNNGANTIRNCWFDGTISTGTSGWYIGGLIGYVTNTGSQTVVENCLFTGKITSTRTAAPYLGGICGNLQDASPKLTVKKCLVAGEINVANTQYVADVVGYIKTGTVTIESTYVLTSDYPDVGYGTPTGSATSVDKSAILGEGAFVMTALDFEDIWVAKEGKTPELRTFSSKEGQIEIPDTLPDTSWYNTTDTEFVIKTVRQMYGFTELSKTDNFEGKTVKLGADIVFNEGDAKDWGSNAPKNEWTPIGRSKTFKGNFDGQGHTISGMYVSETQNGAGLFRDVALTSTIKDFRLVNSYVKTTKPIAGAVAGWGYGALDSIYTDAIVESSSNTIGGLVGAKNNGENKISNCWFDGEIKAGSSSYYIGGIVGYAANAASKTTVENCLFTGKISCSATGALYLGGIWGALYTNSPRVDVKDCLVAGEFDITSSERVGDVVGSISSGTVTLNDVYVLTSPYNASGTGGIASGSTISFDKSAICGSGAFQMTGLDFVNYWVAKEGKTPELQSFSSAAGSININKMNADTSWYNTTDNVFTINTVEQLYGLAELSASNNFSGKTIKLGKDISINEGNAKDWKQSAPTNTWTPMGSFAGTFDGQGHSISGLYISSTSINTGLFSQTTSTSTIKDLWITNSYIKSTNRNVGTIAGIGLGTFDTIYSNAIIDVDYYYIGGIVGYVNSGTNNVVKNCWFNGRINGTAQAGYYLGGIVGCVENATTVTMENCLNSGKITSIRTDRCVVGGLAASSYHAGSKLIIKNSMFTGYFDTVNKYTLGTAVGYVPNGTVELTNVYGVLDENPGIGTNGATNNGTVTGSVTLIAKEQLQGKAARANASALNYDGVWMTVDGATPILQSFSNYTSEGITGMLLGNSISKYRIVIAKDASTLTQLLAEHFQGMVMDETGASLAIVTDDQAPSGYEITIGSTNRDVSKLLYANGAYTGTDYGYAIKSSANNVAFGYTDSTALISAWEKFFVLMKNDTSAGIDAKGTDETVTGVAKTDSSYVRIMSSNIYSKNDTSFDGLGMPWKARAEIMAEVYRVYKPDFIGFQEATFEQQDEIIKYIDDLYAIVDFPQASKNNTPLLYRKDLYDIEAKHYYDFTGGRHLEWALYSSKANPSEKFIHMNLHYSPYVDEQPPQAEIVNAEIKRVMQLYPNVPIAITGDYNNSALSETYAIMVNGINMASGAAIVGNEDSIYYTWHRLGEEVLETTYKDGTTGPIDIVSITTDFIEAKDYKMIHDPIVCWGADHYPVYLDVKRK